MTWIRPDNEQKLRDILKRLGMDSRRITGYSQLQEMYDSMPDYHKTNEINIKEKNDGLFEKSFILIMNKGDID